MVGDAALGSQRSRVRIPPPPCLGSLWCNFGIILGSSWGHLGVILGSSWGHLGVTLGSVWDHIGITLGSLWHRSGTKDSHQNVAEQIWALESRSRAISWGKIRRISSSTRSDCSWGTKKGWRQRAKPLDITFSLVRNKLRS